MTLAPVAKIAGTKATISYSLRPFVLYWVLKLGPTVVETAVTLNLFTAGWGRKKLTDIRENICCVSRHEQCF